MKSKPTYDELAQRVEELEKAFESQKRLMNTLLDNLQVGVFMVEAPSGKPILANKRAMDLLGRGIMNDADKDTLAEVYKAYKSGTFDFYPQDQMPIVRGMYGESHRIDDMVVEKPDGTRVLLEVFGSAVKDDRGSIAASLVSFSDITERKAAENARLESQRFLSNIFNSIRDGISILDTDLRIVRVNEWMEKMYPDQTPLVGKKCYEVYQGRDTECPWCPSMKTIETGETQSAIVPFPSEEKPAGWIDLSAFPLFDQNGRISGVIEYVKDITELKRVEEALKDSNESLQTVLDSIPADVYVADMDTHEVIFMNQQMKSSFGRDCVGETCWRAFRELDGPCTHCTNPKLLDDKGESTGVRIWEDKNPVNQKYYINYDQAVPWVDGRYVRIQIAMDITEKSNLEKQLQQAQKIESIGRLAGGVAHDLNNLLSPILGYGEILLEDFHMDDERKSYVEEILKAGSRARDLVHQLLAFSRKQLLEFKPLNLNEVLARFEALIRRTIREDIDIEIITGATETVVSGDTGQLEQVIMNLVVNAQDAMPDGGKLTIETANTTLDETYAGAHSGVIPGEYLMLSISDTG